MDRGGKATNITSEVKPYGYPFISADGKQIAVTLESSSYDAWVYDVERDTITRASFGGDDYRPHLSPDGRMLGYDSSKSGQQQVYVKQGITQAAETQITDGPELKEFYGFTPDGREVIFGRQNKDTGWDLYAAAIAGDHKPRPLAVAPFNQVGARLSPDGKWLAYVSDESGQAEIFVQAMNDPSIRAQVSSEGGENPRWARSSNEVFFTSKNRLMSVKLAPGGGLSPGKPVLMFEDKIKWEGYDVAPDGRFVVVRDADTKGLGTQINVVLNWFEELKRQPAK
jgi:Tol biopolymer transport system component